MDETKSLGMTSLLSVFLVRVLVCPTLDCNLASVHLLSSFSSFLFLRLGFFACRSGGVGFLLPWRYRVWGGTRSGAWARGRGGAARRFTGIAEKQDKNE